MNTGYKLATEDYNKILSHADKTIVELREEIKIYKILISQLKSQEGKQITKRIMNYVKLEGYNTYYTKRYEHFYIGVSKGNFRKEITLAEYQATKLDIKHIEKSLLNRESQLIKDLAVQENITQIVIQYNTSLECYKAAEEQLKTLPGWFTLNRW